MDDELKALQALRSWLAAEQAAATPHLSRTQIWLLGRAADWGREWLEQPDTAANTSAASHVPVAVPTSYQSPECTQGAHEDCDGECSNCGRNCRCRCHRTAAHQTPPPARRGVQLTLLGEDELPAAA